MYTLSNGYFGRVLYIVFIKTLFSYLFKPYSNIYVLYSIITNFTGKLLSYKLDYSL